MDQRCDNFRQALEYIIANKSQDYLNSPELFKRLISLVLSHNDMMANNIERLQSRLEDQQNHGTLEVQEYQQQNEELEGEIEHLEAELQKMRLYEKSYHTQEKRLQASLNRVDALQAEKENIEAAHTDLIIDYNQVKQQNENYTVENKAMKIQVEELTTQVAHLKKQIIYQYDTMHSEIAPSEPEQDERESLLSPIDQIPEAQGPSLDESNAQDIPSEISMLLPSTDLRDLQENP